MRIFPILGWMLFPGCWAMMGSRTVRGPAGGSVAVQCQYKNDYKDSSKYWCRAGGNTVIQWCSKGVIVETDGSEAEVKRGRVSIRDNPPQRAFTVTVENLTLADAGTYHCGVQRTVIPDLRTTVELIVSPASPPTTESSSSATEPPASSSPAKSISIRTTTEDGKSSVSTNQGTSAPRARDSDILFHILLPCVLLVLMLFLVAAVMLVRLSKKRKKALSGASVQRDKKIHLSNLGSEATEEVSYATVTITTPDQQPIYANVDQRPKTRHPANPPEETLYSAVK